MSSDKVAVISAMLLNRHGVQKNSTFSRCPHIHSPITFYIKLDVKLNALTYSEPLFLKIDTQTTNMNKIIFAVFSFNESKPFVAVIFSYSTLSQAQTSSSI